MLPQITGTPSEDFPWDNLVTEPKVIGQYENGLPQYAIALPVKGRPVAKVFFEGALVDEAKTKMAALKFKQEQNWAVSLVKPQHKWHVIGYTLDPNGVWGYYQVDLYAGYGNTQTYDSAWASVVPRPTPVETDIVP